MPLSLLDSCILQKLDNNSHSSEYLVTIDVISASIEVELQVTQVLVSNREWLSLSWQ